MLIYRWWPGAGVFSPAPAPAKKSVSAGSGSTTLATLDSKICQFWSLKKRFINKNLFWIIFGFINSELISCLLQKESFSFLLAPTVQKIGSGADQKWRLRLGNTFTKLKFFFLQKYILQDLLICNSNNQVLIQHVVRFGWYRRRTGADTTLPVLWINWFLFANITVVEYNQILA